MGRRKEEPEPCTRCGADTGFLPTRFHYWVKYSLRLKTLQRSVLTLARVRDHGWHAKTSGESMDAFFSELLLCNDCVVAVWMFAQGKEDKSEPDPRP